MAKMVGLLLGTLFFAIASPAAASHYYWDEYYYDPLYYESYYYPYEYYEYSYYSPMPMYYYPEPYARVRGYIHGGYVY